MYILIHQNNVLSYGTKEKNIVNSVSLYFLETFLTIAKIAPKTCTAQHLPTASIWN